MAASSRNSKKVKATYEGYASFDIEESSLKQAYALLEPGIDLWAWLDQKTLEGYEFSIEAIPAQGICQVVMMARDTSMPDKGLYLYTSALNTIEAIVLTWYKYEHLGKGNPLKKAEPKPTRIYR